MKNLEEDEQKIMTQYEQRVRGRGRLRYLLGLLVRWRARRRMDRVIRALRRNGATIGESVSLTPGCRKIGRGAVVGAGAVVAKDVPPMAIVAGNPATLLRMRKCVHENLVVESLLGGDFAAYREARR